MTFGGALPSAQAAADAFTVMRQLHELLWYLTESQARLAAGPLRDEVDRALDGATRAAAGTPEEVAAVDGAALRREVGELLGRVSEALRRPPGKDHRHADLVGARLRGANLRGADLRGALLLGAGLRGADLRRADLLGTDLRGADVRGAKLAEALFLTQPQVTAARGDATTTLPPRLERPGHWAD